MSVSVFFIIIVDISPDKDVRDTLKILTWHVFGVHDGETNLVVFDRLWSDIPHLLLFALLVAWLNFKPAGDNTLRQRCTLVIDLAVLDRLFFNGLPVSVEEAIIKVDRGLANKIISK